MHSTNPTRAGLLGLITITHIGAIWWLAGLSTTPVRPPVPLPAIMVEMLSPTPAVQPEPARQSPPPQAKPTPAKSKPETPRPVKPRPQVTPQPTPEPAPQPTPVAAAPAAPSPTPAPAAPATPVAPAPAVSAAPAAAPAPVAITPPRYNAAYLSNPVPVYPAMLRRAGEEGRVMLRVLVTADGNAGEVQVLQPASSPLFDEAALAAVKRWRFVPARRGDQPVAEWVKVPIDFKLN